MKKRVGIFLKFKFLMIVLISVILIIILFILFNIFDELKTRQFIVEELKELEGLYKTKSLEGYNLTEVGILLDQVENSFDNGYYQEALEKLEDSRKLFITLTLETFCGNGICDSNEICSSCSEDCGECYKDSEGNTGDGGGGGSSGGGGSGGGGSGGGGSGGGESCIPNLEVVTCNEVVCGTKINNCQETISCGSCEQGFYCLDGICINQSLNCTDWLGIDYFSKDYAYNGSLFWDSCNGGNLTEYYCSNNSEIKEDITICKEGCEDGACILPGYHDFSLLHDGLNRTYHVYVPISYNKSVKTPVVFVIHGGGGNGDQVRGTQNMDEIADREGFVVVYPDGTGIEIFGKKLFTWNSGNCCGQAVEKKIDDVGFFGKMISDLPNTFNVDRQRIYATGISNGGQMSHRLACELSNKIAAVAPIAGPVGVDNATPPCYNLDSIPVLIYHGKQDPCALYDGGCLQSGGCFNESFGIGGGEIACILPIEEVKNRWIIRNGCSNQSNVTYNKGDVQCLTYSQCDENSEVVLCTSETAGHQWPNATDPGNETVMGNVTYNISNEQIWEFFEKHKSGCMDGICSAYEDCYICPDDCGVCSGQFGLFLECSDVQTGCNLTLANSIGVKINRDIISWFVVEPTETGGFNFNLTDESGDLHKENRVLSSVITLGSKSPWGTRTAYVPGSQGSSPPKNMSRYRNFVREVVKRYKDDNKYWQIENEVNVPLYWNGTKEEYKDLLVNAYEVIKEEDPEAKVVLAGFSNGLLIAASLGELNSLEFFNYMMNDTKDYFDVIDFHQYLDYNVSETEVKLIKDAMNSYGYDKEIISTEIGDPHLSKSYSVFFGHRLPIIAEILSNTTINDSWNSFGYGLPENNPKEFGIFLKSESSSRKIIEKYQAENLVKRMSLTASLGVTQMHWFSMQDKSYVNALDWFQIIMGLIDDDGRKKPHYYTYELLIDKLKSFRVAENLSENPTIIKFSFNNKNPIFVAWDDNGAIIDLSPYITTENVTVTHIITELDSNNNPIYLNDKVSPVSTIEINETPIFIEETTIILESPISESKKTEKALQFIDKRLAEISATIKKIISNVRKKLSM